MQQFTVVINIGNAATVDDDGKPDPDAIGRYLARVASRVQDNRTWSGEIHDDNGARIGSFGLDRERQR